MSFASVSNLAGASGERAGAVAICADVYALKSGK